MTSSQAIIPSGVWRAPASLGPVSTGIRHGAPASKRSFVEFDRVSKTYDGESLAVADLSLSIARNEFLTLLGPSGSGKTTALMMLAGFEEPTEGDIRLDGASLRRVPPYERNIGVVFQNYALFPHMSVADNITFPLQVRKVDRAESQKRAARALELVRLSRFEKRRPAELSGGQQQRVALARALIFDPLLILMDEPLGALDKQLREQLQIEIKHIQKNLGVTVVYVTHDQSEALTMSDRIAVFNNGSIQQVATPSELYEQPQSAFVAQFIGESSQLVGTVRSIENDGRCQVEIAGGAMVKALAINVAEVGSRTTLAIRPERIALSPGDGECESVLSAVVEELIYQGDHTRARLRVADSPNFVLKVPHTRDKTALSPGETITVGWQCVDCRALDGPRE